MGSATPPPPDAPGSRPAALLAGLRSSFGLALAIVVLAIPGMLLVRLIEPDLPTLVAFLGICAYSVIDPVLNVTRRSWWVGALISFAAWLVLFPVLCVAAEAMHRIGETGMIFVLPIMGYPVMLGISGLVKLAIWTTARATANRPIA